MLRVNAGLRAILEGAFCPPRGTPLPVRERGRVDSHLHLIGPTPHLHPLPFIARGEGIAFQNLSARQSRFHLIN
jgi:hypothetical protein